MIQPIAPGLPVQVQGNLYSPCLISRPGQKKLVRHEGVAFYDQARQWWFVVDAMPDEGVRRVWLEDFANGALVTVKGHAVPGTEPAIGERAQQAQAGTYNLASANCEDWARWIMYGEASSPPARLGMWW